MNIENIKKILIDRRTLFRIGLFSFVSFIVASIGGTVRFFFPKVLFEPKMTFKAGKPEDFPEGQVSTKFIDDNRTWIIHAENGIYALIANCTHLGCTPNWFYDEKLFKCPCHGSNFDINGDVLAGPAPEPLFRAMVNLDSFGNIIINKLVKENDPKKREHKDFLLKT